MEYTQHIPRIFQSDNSNANIVIIHWNCGIITPGSNNPRSWRWYLGGIVTQYIYPPKIKSWKSLEKCFQMFPGWRLFMDSKFPTLRCWPCYIPSLIKAPQDPQDPQSPQWNRSSAEPFPWQNFVADLLQLLEAHEKIIFYDAGKSLLSRPRKTKQQSKSEWLKVVVKNICYLLLPTSCVFIDLVSCGIGSPAMFRAWGKCSLRWAWPMVFEFFGVSLNIHFIHSVSAAVDYIEPL